MLLLIIAVVVGLVWAASTLTPGTLLIVAFVAPTVLIVLAGACRRRS